MIAVMQSRRWLKVSALISCVVTLTACAAGPNLDPGTLATPEATISATPASDIKLLYSTASATPSTTTSPSPVLGTKNTQEGSTVKTLKDFTPIKATSATIATNKGDIIIKLFSDKVPLTVTNFATLAKSGFYDGIKFHRIIADFMAQVGDPLTKDASKQAMWGTGGPGYTITDEFVADLKHDKPGIVSMANTGQPATGGSQFFITYEPTPWLDGKHAVFGEVTSGMDVVNKLEMGDEIKSIKIQ